MNRGRMISLLAGVVIITAGVAVVTLMSRPQAPAGMVWLPGSEFLMGSNRGLPDEAPAHRVKLRGYWIDRYEVSRREFGDFVRATGYITSAEKLGSSSVFIQPQDGESLAAMTWWQLVDGADWRDPVGAGDAAGASGEHPVVQVSYDDALAYCNWLGKSLPSEAQFEYAARGGREGEVYSWGNAPAHRTEKLLNHWQGTFPQHNDNTDGHVGTAPVGSFPANDFGLYDITGNVWEWVSDWYHPRYYAMSPRVNPTGVSSEESVDPNEPGLPKRGIRGGSFLCAENYCSGFRVSARMPADPGTGTNHTGFRCVRNGGWLEGLTR